VDLARHRFRLSPAYDLVSTASLQASDVGTLEELVGDPRFAAVLLPHAADGLGTHALDAATTDLFRRLECPARLPPGIVATLGARSTATVLAWVFDHILEIEGSVGFVTGPAALESVLADEGPAESGPASTDARSIEALRYGQALPILDPVALSARLYFYNRLPISPDWRTRLASPAAVDSFLGLRPGSRLARRVRRDWVEESPPSLFDRWRLFRRRSGSGNPARHTRFKLYISPLPEDLPAALSTALELVERSDATKFKVGKHVDGLLRPDKLIFYFRERSAMDRMADRLTPALRALRPHGVPFTAAIPGSGLLSWGADPPRDTRVLSSQERESWRLWVTNRLAAALLVARGSDPTRAPAWQLALERLRLDGINPATWTPVEGAWTALQ
jgi:hypothetical protein